MKFKNKEVRFTDHAYDRLEDIKLTDIMAVILLNQSKPQLLPKGLTYQKKKYKTKSQKDIFYYLHPVYNILFTVKQRDKEILIITVTQK